MIREDVEKILLKVQKPGRYVGGELNEVIKDKAKVDLRFAFCFPDTYEVGMSHLGMKILYSLCFASFFVFLILTNVRTSWYMTAAMLTCAAFFFCWN